MVLADTGDWLALANPRDRWHGAVVAATRRLAEALLVNATLATARALLDERVKVGSLEARGRTRARRYHLRR